ncbi:hypothetical protein SAMN02745129_1224 [Ferrimonas marina]|uniref:Prepilin peptidase dependent protein C n=2 Tax=Ferrimonas marina TaxID=299255 RepID=A0A1M5NYJ7_9GAMM|nr:hypothetical protein SAMN02745129_1224 [Ferrimonas marina]
MRRQRGDILLEALLSTVMMTITFLGLHGALKSTLRTQAEANGHNLTRLQMRSTQEQSELTTLCQNASVSNEVVGHTLSYDVVCLNNEVTVSLQSQLSHTLPDQITSVSLRTMANENSEALLGGDGVMELW